MMEGQMKKVTGWSGWSITRKVQVVFVLAGTVVPIALLLLTIFSSSGPDWEGGFWPVAVLGVAAGSWHNAVQGFRDRRVHLFDRVHYERCNFLPPGDTFRLARKRKEEALRKMNPT
jgi:hypothetical protein